MPNATKIELFTSYEHKHSQVFKPLSTHRRPILALRYDLKLTLIQKILLIMLITEARVANNPTNLV